MLDRLTPKPALSSSADYPQMECVLAEHLEWHAHSLVGCGRTLEAREAIRELAAAQLRALKAALRVGVERLEGGRICSALDRSHQWVSVQSRRDLLTRWWGMSCSHDGEPRRNAAPNQDAGLVSSTSTCPRPACPISQRCSRPPASGHKRVHQRHRQGEKPTERCREENTELGRCRARVVVAGPWQALRPTLPFLGRVGDMDHITRRRAIRSMTTRHIPAF